MFELAILDNGLSVITSPMQDRESISVGIWIRAGGRYEIKKYCGISHLIEHMLFKGTKKRTCEQLKEAIEGIGGSFNGFTSEDATCYLVKIPKSALSTSVDILTDMVFNPNFSYLELEKEKQVIIEEIKMYYDMPHHLAEENLQQMMWPDNPLGFLLTGTEKTVSAINIKILKDFYAKYYTPNNIVLVACGATTHREFTELAQTFTKKQKKRSVVRYKKARDTQRIPRFHFFNKDTQQTRIALGFNSVSRNNPKSVDVNLMNIILGGNMSSRLFNEIREKRGLVYDISSSAKKFSDTGIYEITAGTDSRLALKTIQVIMKQLSKIRKIPVTANELKRAKEYYIGQLKLSLEETMERMLWLGERYITGSSIALPEKTIQQIEKVTKESIQIQAKKLFRTKKINLSMVGQLDTKYTDKIKKACIIL